MGRKKHIEFLREFKKRLSKGISVNKLILFGSRAKGYPRRWSDFDLMIVSPEFEKFENLKRGIGFYNYWELDYPVDFLCYTLKEFEVLKIKISTAFIRSCCAAILCRSVLLNPGKTEWRKAE